jgi:actin-related protein 6
LQGLIWKEAFASLIAQKNVSDHKLLEHLQQKSLLMTVQPSLPFNVMERYAELIFEDFQFESFGMVTSHSMIRLAALEQTSIESPCQIVVDSGFSFTYGVPFFDGIPMKQASLRIDVGGKLLTNLLTE